jgi:uncharacterized membrane protein YhaH (DUF805 family)
VLWRRLRESGSIDFELCRSGAEKRLPPDADVLRAGTTNGKSEKPANEGGPMSMTQLLFLFQGRLNRQPYWLVAIAVTIVITLLVLFAWATGEEDEVIFNAPLVIVAMLCIPLAWIGFAVAVKRLHDRDKSAWWLIVFYVVPAILGTIAYFLGMAGAVLNLISFGILVWAFVEIGCLRGTRGANRYGPNPLGRAA